MRTGSVVRPNSESTVAKADASAEGAEPVLTDRQKARERKAKEKVVAVVAVRLQLTLSN
jgi:hypothetical protein